MNTMIYTILFSLLAMASADRLRIVNNCAADFEISSIYFPTGTGIQCFKMKKIAVGNQIVIDNFFYDEDVVLLKSSAKTDSDNFKYIDTLRSVMRNEDDIGGECAKLVKSGNVGVYSVEPGVPYLILCANKPSPKPNKSVIQPTDIRITNTCAKSVSISFMQYIGDSGVYCSRLQTLRAGETFDTTVQLSLDFLVLRGPVVSTTEDIKYVNSLKKAISGTTDSFDGVCHEIAKTGGDVYTITKGVKLVELCGSPKPAPKPRSFGPTDN